MAATNRIRLAHLNAIDISSPENFALTALLIPGRTVGVPHLAAVLRLGKERNDCLVGTAHSNVPF